MTERQSALLAKAEESLQGARLLLRGDYALRSGLTADDAQEQIAHAVEFIEIARRKLS